MENYLVRKTIWLGIQMILLMTWIVGKLLQSRGEKRYMYSSYASGLTYPYMNLHISGEYLLCFRNSKSGCTKSFLWASWLPVFWTLHLIGWLSLHHLVVFFLEFQSVLSFGPYFFVSTLLLRSKGQSLRYSPGRGNPRCCIVALYVGEGSEREQGCMLSSHPSFSHFPTSHKQIVPF